MSLEPEDLMSAEEEAEIQRNHILAYAEETTENLQRALIMYHATPPDRRSPDVLAHLHHAVDLHAAWMKQNGINTPQPDVDL